MSLVLCCDTHNSWSVTVDIFALQKLEAENAELRQKVQRLEAVRDAADKATRVPNVQFRGENDMKMALALIDICKAIDALNAAGEEENNA